MSVYFVGAKTGLIDCDISSYLTALICFPDRSPFAHFHVLCQTDQVTDFMAWSQESCFQRDALPFTILTVATEMWTSEGK